MNHLAHLLLAGDHPEHRLGALLGDHLKGRAVLDELAPETTRGVVLHRRIDGWSDRHRAVVALLGRLEPPWRRYGGVILDILFDHMLDRHWRQFADRPLAEFAADTDALLAEHRHRLPPRLARFSLWAGQVDLWQRFGDRDMLAEIFALVAARHGRPSPLARGLEVLDAMDGRIEAAFLALFPELAQRSQAFLGDRDAARSGRP